MTDHLFEKYGKKAKAGEVLFTAGEPGDQMFVIRSGKVKISISSQSGINKTLAVLGPGEFAGEMSVLTDQPRSATATVIEDAELMVVGSKILEEMIIHNTEIALRLIRKLASRMAAADSLIRVLLHRDAKERIIENLKRLSTLHKSKDGQAAKFKADFTEMAEQVGLPAKDVEEIILRLVRAGFIIQDGSFWIISNVDDIDDFLNFLRLKEQYT